MSVHSGPGSGGFAADVALAVAALLLWMLAYGTYFWPDLRGWWRRRREPAEQRMLAAHAEWVRRVNVVRPALPRRPAFARQPARPAGPPPRPVAAPAPAPASAPGNVIPFPNPADRPRR